MCKPKDVLKKAADTTLKVGTLGQVGVDDVKNIYGEVTGQNAVKKAEAQQKELLARQREEQAAAEARIQAGLASLSDAFAGFDDNYFAKQAEAYRSHYMPLLNEQHGAASDQLTFALQRAGLGRSATAATRGADLARDKGRAQAEVAGRAEDFALQGRTQVAQERDRLAGLIQSGSDPTVVNQSLGSSLHALQSIPTFNPMGPVFQNTAAGIGAHRYGTQVQDIRDRYPMASAAGGRGSSYAIVR